MKLFLSLSVIFFIQILPAETLNETSVKQDGYKSFDDLDAEIANKKMLTTSGSKSRYSLSIVSGYTGGSLQDPFSKDMPDLFGGDINYQVGAFLDNSLRYRINKRKSLSLGYGLSIVQPFHKITSEQSKYTDKIEFSNPYLSFSHFEGKSAFMYSFSASITYFTQSLSSDLGYLLKPIVSSTLIYNFTNPFQVGLSASSGINLFNDKLTQASGAFDFTFNWSPFVEYQLRDNLSLRSHLSFGLSHSVFKQSDEGHWVNNLVSQSFGLGYNYSRNIYLYPSLTFSAQDFYKKTTFKKTLVGISATVNVF